MSVGLGTLAEIKKSNTPLSFAVLENVVFDEHNREVYYGDRSVTGKIQLKCGSPPQTNSLQVPLIITPT